jgi:Fe-S-cluster-containing hydrogenase component 2
MKRILAVTELPALDERRCIGCGDCIYVCPTDCLAMKGAYPWLPRPLDCVSCGLCAVVCPVDALQLNSPESA